MSDLWGQYTKSLEKYIDNSTVKDLSYATHVSLKYKYIYVETPKVACSTVKMTLQRLELEDPFFTRDDFEDLHRREYSPLLKLQQIPDFSSYFTRSDFYKFCFVREPYQRLLSCYLDKICRPTNFKKMVLKAMGLDEADINRNISFDEFVEVVENQSPVEMDYHWRPQYYLTCQKNIKYDYIGRLELFSSDFFNIGREISPNFEQYYIPEVRHKTDASTLVSVYYNNELYEKVYEIYEIDFVNFGYEKII